MTEWEWMGPSGREKEPRSRAVEAAGWPHVYEAVRSRVVELEVENSRLQRLVAELLIKNQQLRSGG